MQKTIVCLVDDHTIICTGIESYLIGNNEFELRNCVLAGQELLNKLKEKRPDILLLDIKMPGLSGLQITKIVSKEYPEIKIIIFSSNIDKETIDEAVKSGCVGYLAKDVEEEEFLYALQKVKSGENYFSKNIQQAVFNNYTEAAKFKTNNNELLSSREIEIVKLFSEGLSYNDIAEKLFISTRTVETHKKNILIKLELKSTVDLVKYAILNGIISIY